jgi:hypothetical protein
MSDSDWEYVDSSNIEAIRYDAANREIQVQFHGGRSYAYANADQWVFDEFRDAASKGSYLNRVLKPDHEVREL